VDNTANIYVWYSKELLTFYDGVRMIQQTNIHI